MPKTEQNLLAGLRNEMVFLKILPIILAIIHFLNIILLFNGVFLSFLSILSQIGIIPLLFIYLSSYVFKFCYYHRLSLHYIVLSQGLLIFDEYIGIPCNLLVLLIIHILLFLWLIFSLIYFKYVVRIKNRL